MNALLLALLLMGTVSANSLMFYNSADNCDITTDVSNYDLPFPSLRLYFRSFHTLS